MADQQEYSVSCSSCPNQLVGQADSTFQFIAGARVAGWVVPDALDNKPIKCPTCKLK